MTSPAQVEQIAAGLDRHGLTVAAQTLRNVEAQRLKLERENAALKAFGKLYSNAVDLAVCESPTTGQISVIPLTGDGCFVIPYLTRSDASGR